LPAAIGRLRFAAFPLAAHRLGIEQYRTTQSLLSDRGSAVPLRRDRAAPNFLC